MYVTVQFGKILLCLATIKHNLFHIESRFYNSLSWIEISTMCIFFLKALTIVIEF